ncbi:MAG: hypothetical protein KBT03_10370 [Bacteroidales bacterium]|nr:hypothetical protein [Candidatus Scybalousia scybalohippi]
MEYLTNDQMLTAIKTGKINYASVIENDIDFFAISMTDNINIEFHLSEIVFLSYIRVLYNNHIIYIQDIPKEILTDIRFYAKQRGNEWVKSVIDEAFTADGFDALMQ